MNKEIICEECREKYVPEKNFNPVFAFAWCPKCLDDYERDYNYRLKEAIKKHLKSDFKNEYEVEKFA